MMVTTAEDYMATLATMVLLRSGCDSFPVDTRNLLCHVARITRSGEEVTITKDDSGYTISIPEKKPLGTALCAELLLSLLMDSMGRQFRDDNARRHFVFVFSCHLLCPRPVFRLTGRNWSSITFLEDTLGIPRWMVKKLPECPACYVPKDMNIRLLSQLREKYPSMGANDNTNEIALRLYLTGYEDELDELEEPPAINTSPLLEAVNALVPEHVLTEGHPASLYIEYTEDFEVFSRQFSRLDLAILYASLFEEAPPMPLFGGKPEPGCKAYADRMGRYLSCESSARIAMANAFYQRRYHPSEADILTLSIRKLFELPRR